jgi:hypothetical protein
MVNFQFFVYDSSIAAPLSRVPVWPYSLTYQMPHKCHGNAQNCPSRYCLPTCTVYSVLPTLSPTRCRISATAMRKIAPAGTAYLLVQCTVYIPYSLTYQMPHKCHGNAQNCPSRYCLPTCTVYRHPYSLTYLYSVQCTDIHTPSPTRCRTNAMAMRRIAPAGTAYLPVHCTVYSLLSHLPDAAQVSRQCAELPQQVLPTYLPVQCTDMPTPSSTRYQKHSHGNAQNCPSRYCLPTCTLYRHPYSLTNQMPHKCHGNAQNCPSRYCLPTCTLYSVFPTLSPTRCRTSVTEIPQQVLHTYLYSVQCTPYSLTYQMPHKCHGNAQNCPSRYCIPTCTLYSVLPTLSLTRYHKQCHGNAQNCPSRYCLPTCTVYRRTCSLTCQILQTVSWQCAELHIYLYRGTVYCTRTRNQCA